MRKLFVLVALSLFICTSCGGDDDGANFIGPSGSPPVISSLACDPTSAAIGEGGGAIQMDCSLFFRDPDGDLEDIVFSYLDGCGTDPGPLYIDVTLQAGVQEEGDIDLRNLQVKTTCAADVTYTYEFVAVDSKGNESDPLVQPFVLVGP